MYSKEQIASGLELAQAWYEGWVFNEIEPDQLFEAIDKAKKVDKIVNS